MTARSVRDWERLGSEAECEDRIAGADQSPIEDAELAELLDYHYDEDLADPTICEDRDEAVAALVRGYRGR